MPVCDEVDMKISGDRMSTRPPQVARPCLRSITTERGREVLRKRSRVLSRRPPPPCVTSDGRETVGLTDQVNQRSRISAHCKPVSVKCQIVVVMPVSIFASTQRKKKSEREKKKEPTFPNFGRGMFFRAHSLLGRGLRRSRIRPQMGFA